MDSGGQHGRRFVHLHHTHRPQKKSFVQTRAETPDTGAEAVKPDPASSWEGRSGWMGASIGNENALGECPPTPHSIDDPVSAPHVCCCCQIDQRVVVRRVQMGVPI